VFRPINKYNLKVQFDPDHWPNKVIQPLISSLNHNSNVAITFHNGNIEDIDIE